MSVYDQSNQLPQFPQAVVPAERRPAYTTPVGSDGRLNTNPQITRQDQHESLVNNPTDNHNGALSRTSCICYFDITDQIRQNGMMWLRNILLLLLDAPIFPAAGLFCYFLHYVPNDDNEELESGPVTMSDLPSSRMGIVSRQFHMKAEGMLKAWEIIKLTSVFFISAAPVMLQIQPVYMNIVPRALTVASGLLSMSSLISSYLYVQAVDRFMQTRAIDERWRRSRKNFGDAFWKLVALPFAFILWSSLLFSGVVGYFVWGNGFATSTIADGAGSNSMEIQHSEVFLGAIFVTSIPVYAFYKIYNAMSEIYAD